MKIIIIPMSSNMPSRILVILRDCLPESVRVAFRMLPEIMIMKYARYIFLGQHLLQEEAVDRDLFALA